MDIDSPHLLIIDDDNRIRELLSKYLRENNFFISSAKDTIEARSLLQEFLFDLLIVDVMMPGETGIEFVSDIRRFITTPIIMLTAMSEPTNRIIGLEVGADDYVVKPFEPKELLLRISKLITRQSNHIINIGNFKFNMKINRLTINDEIVPLTSSESKLLSILCSRKNTAVNRSTLAKLCNDVNERSVDVQIIRLRNKIEKDPRRPVHLQTIRGSGYMMVDGL